MRSLRSPSRVLQWKGVVSLGFCALLLSSAGHGVEFPGEPYVRLLTDRGSREGSLETLERQWQKGHEIFVLETMSLSGDFLLNERLLDLLERKTGKRLPQELDPWYEWLWAREEIVPDGYEAFKAELYGLIDPRFRAYFDRERPRTIRLDEVRWGGVRQDGIPPLRHPKMVAAADATYLDDSNVVFGLEVEGEARAYPKRILAWHEMFTDTLGGVSVVGVYCTLCGSMILYDTQVGDTVHELGTSGFLYRSNKLMYDRATQSLWNTLWGEPVIGPLVGQGIVLERRSIVTTTWKAWRELHPDTLVLSLDTGYRRDYSEGAAYRDYFATDELMFTVPEHDRRLKNKAEVLGLVFRQAPQQALAVSSKFLKKNRIYYDQLGDVRFVVVTDDSGAHRVYESGSISLKKWQAPDRLVDQEGHSWQMTEPFLTSDDGRRLSRLPSHNAFWFGWFSAYSHTRLVK